MKTDTKKVKKKTAKAVELPTEALTPPPVENQPTQEVTAPTEKPSKPTKTTAKAATQKAEKSLSRRLKEIVVREPQISIDALYDKLVAEGYTGRSKVTIATLRSDCLTTLAAARDAGLYSLEI
jgi:hypothetical protein